MPGQSLGDLFAPAYNAGGDNSALEAWRARNANLTRADVEATRMPTSFNVGNSGGMVDPAALQAMAQGGHYDMDARRNAIAAQVQANQQQAAAAPANPMAAYWQMYGSKMGGMPGATPAVQWGGAPQGGGALPDVSNTWGFNVNPAV